MCACVCACVHRYTCTSILENRMNILTLISVALFLSLSSFLSVSPWQQLIRYWNFIRHWYRNICTATPSFLLRVQETAHRSRRLEAHPRDDDDDNGNVVVIVVGLEIRAIARFQRTMRFPRRQEGGRRARVVLSLLCTLCTPPRTPVRSRAPTLVGVASR